MTRRIGKINLWQWLTVGAAVLVLSSLHAPSYLPDVVVVIVGVHFIPLARALHCPEYFVSGLCLAALGLLACAARPSGQNAGLATGATGLLLWGTTLAVVRTG